jgi:hypothetical protein
MTYSQFQFLPLRVVAPPSLSQNVTRERYRLLKFTDARDPRHKHLYPISGSMIENYESQSNPRKINHTNEDGSATGRLLDMHDNWCLLPRHILDDIAHNITSNKWREAPYPHRGHPVLYIPGHWGSFFQSRSLGAHGTRWTGPYAKAKSDQEIYESLRTGRGMHDGLSLQIEDHVVDWLTSSKFQQQRRNNLNGFVMDVFALDFDGEGAAWHSSILVRQADFFARAVQTLVQGCHLHPIDDVHHPNNDVYYAQQKRQGGGITIVAHSIGAWIVRIAIKRHPALLDEGYIRNVVTLASPLGSIPYAVDAGVHDLVNGLNNGVGNAVSGDFTMISISGGLRDEMIPPEVCEVPYNQNSTLGFVNSAILASAIVRTVSNSSTSNDRFGMDHRAIVWCYDLLTVVREVIFSLVIATDNGLMSSERMDIATATMMSGGLDDGRGIDPLRNKSRSTYQEQVHDQQMLLLRAIGYWRTVSIQLSALYHLNSLMKLLICAALLDAYMLLPYLYYQTRDQATASVHTRRSKPCLNIALGLLAIPSVAVMVAWMRQSGSWKSCYAQECHLLLGTMFALTQAATVVYYFIVFGVFTLVAFISGIFLTPHINLHLTMKSFWGLLFQLCVEQLRSIALLFLPLTVFTCCTINIFVFGNDDLVWNKTAFDSYCVMTLLLHNVVHLIAAACQPYSLLSFEKRRGEVMIILLLLVRDTCGKVMHEFSLTTKWGQSENSYSGLVERKMITCVTAFMPLVAIMVLRTQDKMAQNFASCNLKNTNIRDGNVATRSRQCELSTLTTVALQSRFMNVAQACLAFWFTWNVSQNDGVLGDMMIPIFTSILVIETYLTCQSYSIEMIEVCSAVTNNDLLLHYDSPNNHDKHE